MYDQIFSKPSLIMRIGVGKLVGLVFGLIGFFILPMVWEGSTPLLQWGVLLWYTTLGAIIGVFGVITYHPILHLPFPWYVRAPFLGAWMNFVLTFFAFDTFQAMMNEAMNGYYAGMSPFWFAAEGAFVGLIIGWLATKFGGEGAGVIDSVTK